MDNTQKALWYPQEGPQTEAVFCPCDIQLFGGSRGGGKALFLNYSSVLTPKGWVGLSKIKTGDIVSDPVSGGSVSVLGVYPQGIMDVYKIVCDDGAICHASIDHLWAYKTANHIRPRTKKSKQREYAILELNAEMPDERWNRLHIGTTADLIKALNNKKHIPRIPLSEPVLFTVNGRTGKGEIQPYLAGLLLGDGSSMSIKMASCDDEIRSYLNSLGFRPMSRLHTDGKPMEWLAAGRIRTALVTWLRNHGLRECRAWEKFIPSYVFTADIEYRLEFLRGLMDTDGTVDDRGRCSFTSTSLKLAEGVQELARSLGGKARLRVRHTKYTHKCVKKDGRESYTVRIWFRKTSALFRLTRKKNRCTDSWNGGHELMREIVSIEKLGKEEAVCIKVSSPYGLYITNDYIVTHNSDTALVGRQMAGALKYGRAWNGIIFRRKYKDLKELRRRVDELIYKGFPAERVGGENQTNIIRLHNSAGGGVITMAACQSIEQLSDWIGMQFVEITIDECTTFPFFTKMIDKLRGSLRSPHGVPCHIFCTGNPGGAGHGQVKGFFRLGSGGHPPKKPFIVTTEALNGVTYDESRVYIPSFLSDNKILCDNDPKYVARLMSISDPVLRKAWIEGNWDVFIGQAFDINEKHIVPVQPIPSNAPIYMTYDWGFGKPFSIGWWWVDQYNNLFRFSEWYGWNGTEDEGLRLEDSRVCEGVIEREKALGIDNREIIRLCDPTCFNKKPDFNGGGQGPSTADIFASYSLNLIPGDANRQLKIRAFRERIAIKNGKPTLFVYDNCVHFLRTIPMLSVDADDPEQIDCFVAGTMIATPDGDVPIEKIKKGDVVSTPIGDRIILKAGMAGKEETITINLSNGEKIEATKDHKIYIKNTGLLPLCMVSTNHKLITKEESWEKTLSFMEELSSEGVEVEDILNAIQAMQAFSEQHSFIESCGNPHMEKFQTDFASITKTTMDITTALKIWNSFLRVVMQDCIGKKELKPVAISRKLLSVGEKATQGKQFFVKTLKNLVQKHRNENLRALIVATILQQEATQKNIVQQDAKKTPTKEKKNVKSAESPSSQKNTTHEKSELAVTSVVGNSEKKAVYYLTVEQAHLFYANNVLTANTDQEDHVFDEACHIAMLYSQSAMPHIKPPTPAEIDWNIITGKDLYDANSKTAFIAND